MSDLAARVEEVVRKDYERIILARAARITHIIQKLEAANYIESKDRVAINIDIQYVEYSTPTTENLLNQLLNRREVVRCLNAIQMAMIPFAPLVIEPHYSFSIDDIDRAVMVKMKARWHRF